MKVVASIVAPAFDVALCAEQIIVARGAQADAERSAERFAGQLQNARGAAQARRLDIGRLLVEARKNFPARGPARAGSETWGRFLARCKLDDSTADRYMVEFSDPTPASSPQRRGELPDGRREEPDDDGQTGPKIAPRTSGDQVFRRATIEDARAIIAQLDDADRKRLLKEGRTNLQGNSGEVERGKWCTPDKWARAVGPWDVDPFSNPHSGIVSVDRAMLEDEGDAFGGGKPGESPGLYLLGSRHGSRTGVATVDTRVWLQPPYDLVIEALAHYGHTRFCALLRLSPDTAWFRMLWPLVATIAIPQERLEFKPPPGVPKPESTISYPHALYYRDWRDITDEVRALCIVIPIDHATSDPRAIQAAAGL